MNTTPASGALVDRTLANLRNAWREVTDSARVALTGVVRPDLPPEDSDRIERQIAAAWKAAAEKCRREPALPI